MAQFNEDTKDPDEIFVTFTFKKDKKQLYIDVNKYAPLREALYILTDKYEWLKNIPAMGASLTQKTGASLKEKPFSPSDLDKPLYTLGIDENSDIYILTDQEVDLFAAAKTLVKQKKQNQQINNQNFNQFNNFPNVNNFNNNNFNQFNNFQSNPNLNNFQPNPKLNNQFQFNQLQFNQNQGFNNFNMQNQQFNQSPNNMNINNQNMNMNNMQNNIQNQPFYKGSTRLREIYTLLTNSGFCQNPQDHLKLINFLNYLLQNNYVFGIPYKNNNANNVWKNFYDCRNSKNKDFKEAVYRISHLFANIDSNVFLKIFANNTIGFNIGQYAQQRKYPLGSNNGPFIPLNNNHRQEECFKLDNNMMNMNQNKMNQNNNMMINNKNMNMMNMNQNKMNMNNNMINMNKMNQNNMINQNKMNMNNMNMMNNMQNNDQNQHFCKSDKLRAIFNYLTSNGFCLPNYKDRGQLINFLNNLYTTGIYNYIPGNMQNPAVWTAFKNVKHNNRHYMEAVYRISYLFPQIKDENMLSKFLTCAQIDSQTFINYGDSRRNKQNNQNMNVNNMQNNAQNNNFNNQLMNGFFGGDWLALDGRPIEALMQNAGITCDKTALFNQICKVIDSIDLNLQHSKDPQEMAEWQRNYCLAMEFLKRYYTQEIGQWYPYHEYPLFFNMYDYSQRFVPTYRDPQTNKWVLGRITFYNPAIHNFDTIQMHEYNGLSNRPHWVRNHGLTCWKDAARNSILHNKYVKALLKKIGEQLSANKGLGIESLHNVNWSTIQQLNDFELLAVFAYVSELACNDPRYKQLCEDIIEKYYKKLAEASPIFAMKTPGDVKDYYNHVTMQLIAEIHKGINLQSNCINQTNPYISYNNFTNTTATQGPALFCEPKGTITNCHGCNNTIYNFQSYTFLINPLNEVKKYTNNLNFLFTNNFLCTLDDCLWYDQKRDLFTGANMNYCNFCQRLCNSSYNNLPPTNSCNLPHLIFNSGKNNCYKERIYLDQYYKTPDGDYLQLVSFEVNMPNHFISFHKVREGNNYKWYMFDDTNGSEETVSEELINQLLHYQYNGTLGKMKYFGPFTVYTADYQPIARQNATDITYWKNTFGQPQENVQTLFGLGQTKCTKLYNPLYNVFYNPKNNNFGEPNHNNPYTAVLGLQKLLMNLGLGKLVNKQMIQDVENLYKNWNNTHYCAGYNNNLYPVQQVNNIFMNPQMFPNNIGANMGMKQGKNMPFKQKVFK